MAVVSGCSRLVLPARFALISSVGGKIALPWQNDVKFRELPRFSHNINSAAVLLHDDVVRHRETKAGSFTGWLGREERVEHLFLHSGRDSGAVVTDANFNSASKVVRRGPEGWFKTRLLTLQLAPGRSIDAVRDQIEER